MVSRIVGRFLYVFYPALVMGFALVAWSSSSLSELARETPPVGDGFNLFWNPVPSAPEACRGDKIQKLNQSCSASNGLKTIEQLSNHQNQTVNKAN